MNSPGEPALHVHRQGPAAGAVPVVMLHGWGMNGRVFDPLRADLDQYATWAIDLPGHGRSPWWPAAASFERQQQTVQRVLPRRCVLLGWSFGAQLALAIAAAEPERVAALVLVAATPKFAQGPDWPHGMEPLALRAFEAALARDWHHTLQDFIALQLRGSRHAEESRAVIEAALAMQGTPQREALLAGMALLESLDLRPLAARIAHPALIVAGQNDRVTPPGATHWLARALVNARLLEIARAGHAPMISHHADVASAMRELLA
jgi:pimeloyl-[acyl-carrier protein] methyl ester esterase